MMNGTFLLRDHLLDELEHGAHTINRLIRRITPEQWDYRPQSNMRSLLELVHHLVKLPATDLSVMREEPGSEFQRIEAQAAHIMEPEALCEWMDGNVSLFKAAIHAMSEDELLHRVTRPFYGDTALVQARWLVETVTHLFHHRAQLFNYLKQLGHPIDMLVLYGQQG